MKQGCKITHSYSKKAARHNIMEPHEKFNYLIISVTKTNSKGFSHKCGFDYYVICSVCD